MNVLSAAAIGLLLSAQSTAPPAVAEQAPPDGAEAVRWSLRYLENRGYATDTASLVAQLQDRGPSPDEIAALVEQLGSPRYGERIAAARQLNLWGGAVVPHLERIAASADIEQQRRIGRLLRRIGERDTRSEDLLLLAVLQELAERQAAVTPAALELLPRLERPGLRDAAARAVWSGARPADASLLRETIRHTDPEVRTVAVLALGRLRGMVGTGNPLTGRSTFTEEFRTDTGRIGSRYGRFTLHSSGGQARVEAGCLLFDGNHDEGDQRLVIDAIDALGRPSFPDTFTVRATLGGDGAKPFNLHMGVSVGNCRVLFHPGHPDGAFRAQTVDKGYFLFSNREMGFTPMPGVLHEMALSVRRNDFGGADFQVTVTDGRTGEQYATRFTARPDQVGPFVSVGLDRGGSRAGGEGFFGSLTLSGLDGQGSR